jgi:hypothetical protein
MGEITQTSVSSRESLASGLQLLPEVATPIHNNGGRHGEGIPNADS